MQPNRQPDGPPHRGQTPTHSNVQGGQVGTSPRARTEASTSTADTDHEARPLLATVGRGVGLALSRPGSVRSCSVSGTPPPTTYPVASHTFRSLSSRGTVQALTRVVLGLTQGADIFSVSCCRERFSGLQICAKISFSPPPCTQQPWHHGACRQRAKSDTDTDTGALGGHHERRRRWLEAAGRGLGRWRTPAAQRVRALA